ncbi:MAG: transcriptional regulator NrdR [Armatimonadota bacterium]|nr:transcriptional regulator NrdR [Armatimonadota bacterium]
MKCPFCGFQEDRVLDSRSVREGESIKRRRECLNCGRRFTTYEEIEEMRILVVKKDQRREPFERGKLLRGMLAACEKRPVSAETLESVADEIERSIYNSGQREITSAEIGEMVMERLSKLDRVAFVRFASVYREFEDVTQFKEIIDVLDRPRRKGRVR